MEELVQNVKTWLEGVERDPDAFVVISPFGFKKMEIGGEPTFNR